MRLTHCESCCDKFWDDGKKRAQHYNHYEPGEYLPNGEVVTGNNLAELCHQCNFQITEKLRFMSCISHNFSTYDIRFILRGLDEKTILQFIFYRISQIKCSAFLVNCMMILPIMVSSSLILFLFPIQVWRVLVIILIEAVMKCLKSKVTFQLWPRVAV